MKTMHGTNLAIKEIKEVGQKLRNGYEGLFLRRKRGGSSLFVVVTFNGRSFSF